MMKIMQKIGVIALLAISLGSCSEDTTSTNPDPGTQQGRPAFVTNPGPLSFDEFAVSDNATFAVKDFDPTIHVFTLNKDGYSIKQGETTDGVTTFTVVKNSATADDFSDLIVSICWGRESVASEDITLSAVELGVIERPATLNTLKKNMRKGEKASTEFRVVGVDGISAADFTIEPVIEFGDTINAFQYLEAEVVAADGDTSGKSYKIDFTVIKNSDLLKDATQKYVVKMKGLVSKTFDVLVPATSTIKSISCVGDMISEAEDGSYIFANKCVDVAAFKIQVADYTINDQFEVMVESVVSTAAEGSSRFIVSELSNASGVCSFEIEPKDAEQEAGVETFVATLNNGNSSEFVVGIDGDIVFAAATTIPMPSNVVDGDEVVVPITVNGIVKVDPTLDDINFSSSALALPAELEEGVVYPEIPNYEDHVEVVSVVKDLDKSSLTKSIYNVTLKSKQSFELDYTFTVKYTINVDGVTSGEFGVSFAKETNISAIKIGAVKYSELAPYALQKDLVSKTKIEFTVALWPANDKNNKVYIESITSSKNDATYYSLPVVPAEGVMKFSITPKGNINKMPSDWNDVITVTLNNGQFATFAIVLSAPASVKAQPTDIVFPYNSAKAAALATVAQFIGIVKDTPIVTLSSSLTKYITTKSAGTVKNTVTFTLKSASPAEMVEGTYTISVAGVTTEERKITIMPSLTYSSVTTLDGADVPLVGGKLTYVSTNKDPQTFVVTLPVGYEETTATSVKSVAITAGSTNDFEFSYTTDIVKNEDGTGSFTVSLQPKASAVSGDAITAKITLSNGSNFVIINKYIPAE